MKRGLGLIAAFLVVAALVHLFFAQGATPQQTPTPPPTFTLTDLGPVQNAAPGGVTALNASGEATGIKLDSTNSFQRAFLYQNGTVTDLGSFSGGNISYGYGINDSGTVAGVAQLSAATAGNTLRAAVWQNGTITSLDNSAANTGFYSGAFGINSAGDVAGYINNGADLPVIWKGGTASGQVMLSTLPCPFTCSGRALAINDAGESAGISVGNDRVNHPVMWDASGNVTDLGTFGSQGYNQANAINKSGLVVGHSQLPLSSGVIVHAFLYQNGTLQDLGTVPGTNAGGTTDTNSSAWGINSNGDIVGISASTTNPVIGPAGGSGGRAFFYTAGTMYDLTSLLASGSGTGWQLENAYAINDSRQIVGVGVAPDHMEHGYLLTLSVAPTRTTVSAFPSTPVYGQQVSFTVTVSPSSASSLTPSGNVTISDGSTTLATVPLASGTAIFNTPTLAVGSHSITAAYGGDSNFSASTSTPLSQVVNQGTTTTSVSASPNPAIVGQSVTLSATVTPVSPAAGTPTGTVTFLDGSTSLGTGTLSGGQATLATSSLASGTHSITVTYTGDPNFLGSTSSAVSVAIQQTTTTTLIVVPNPVNAGQLVTLTATVAGSSGAPTGETVTFLDGATVLGTGTISAGGTATFTTASLAVGNHSLTASYSGDANLAPSTSGTVPLSIALPPAVITDNETITVTDTSSFPDVADAEAIKVTDAVTVYAYFPIAISPVPPILSGVLNQPYSGVTFSGTGGYQTLTLSESGAVPGMSFAIAGASATLSGTPTQAGTFPFIITATDSIGNKLNQKYSLTVSSVCPAISVSPSGSLGVVTADNGFSQAFIASGGVGTTIWSATGALPPGMNFKSGVLFGMPAQPGAFALTIIATDQNGCQGSSNVSLVVLPPPAVITDNETITVTDTTSFPDVYDAESIKVTDQVVIQVISPTTTSISAPGVVYGTPAAVTVSVGSVYGTVSGNVMLSVDVGAATTIALSSGSAVFNAGILTPGTHSLAASFPAQGGFLASSAPGAVFVSQLPVFTSANATTFTVGTAGTFSVTTTGVPFAALTISSGTLPSGVRFTDNLNGTGTLAGIPAPGTGGIYPLTISASNGVLAPVLQSFTLTVDQAPAITSGGSTTFTEGVPGSFTLTSTGFPISALSESPSLPAGLTFFDNGDGTATLSGTPAPGTSGSYAITFVAANGVGSNATQNFTLTINLGLAITSGSGTTFTEQMPGSFLVTTLGFPVASLTETGPLPTGVTFTDNHDGTASLAGTPALGTSNIYPITITANNGVGSSTTQAFTLTVNSTAAITSGSTTTFTVGSTGFFSITTMGTPAPTLTFTGTLPTGVSFVDNGNGTATLSGTPAAGSANSYPLAITANNGVGTAAVQNFTLVVNQGAAILSGNSTTFTVGVPGTFTVMTSGSPTPALTETPPTLPTGVTFVDNGDGTATLSGTPAAGTGGAYPITITANNGVDLPAVQAFTLNINQNPAITSSNMVTFNELVTGSFLVTATGSPVPALTEVGNLPNGVTFTDNGDGTAMLAGIPAAGTGGQYGFTITAANGVLPSATQTFTLTVVPGLNFTSPNHTSFRAGAQSLFTVTTVGTPLPTLTYSGNLPLGVVFTPFSNGTATLSGVPQTGTEGTYSINLTASNGTGASATQVFTLNVYAPGETAPVITSANQATFCAALPPGVPTVADPNPYNYFLVTTTGFPVPTLTAIDRITGKPFPGFKDNKNGTATISFSPRFPYNLLITATGAGGPALAATQQFTLHSFRLPLAPKFTSANYVAFTGGHPASFTIAAGPFVDSIVKTMGTIPASVTLTDNHDGTATLSTIGAGSGEFTITLKASNSHLLYNYTATQSFTIGILPSNQTAPVITSANQATFCAALPPGVPTVADPNPYNYFLVTTTGFPVPTLTAIDRITGKPFPGFKDNKNGTATISFSPRFPYNLLITATGAGGPALAATQQFTLHSFRLPLAPKFTSANYVAFTGGHPASFTIAAGPFVDSIVKTMGTIPASVTLTDNHDGTATLSTIGAGSGEFTITLKASNSHLLYNYTATQSFTIGILPSNQTAPVITSANQATFCAALPPGVPTVADPNPYNYFLVTTTGFPVPTLTAIDRITGKPFPGFKDNKNGTATISFSPRFPYNLLITATGAGGPALAATQQFTLHSFRLPLAPKFTSANYVAFTGGHPASFTIAAGPFVDSIVKTMGTIPASVTLTDNHDGTATLSTIGAGSGEFTITLKASNSHLLYNYTATQSFTIGILP